MNVGIFPFMPCLSSTCAENTRRLRRYTQPPDDTAHAWPSQLSLTGGVI